MSDKNRKICQPRLCHSFGVLWNALAERLHLTRIFNPEEIASSSPGLRGTSYPGKWSQRAANPERVAALPCCMLSLEKLGHNPFRVESSPRLNTQGSSFLATLGFGPESLWDSLSHA